MVHQSAQALAHPKMTALEQSRLDVLRETMITPCRYRDPQDALMQLGWKANADGEWVYVNGRWLEYTGLSREQSLGRGWISAVHRDDRALALDGWDWACAMEERFECLCRLLRREGRPRWFLLRGLPIVDEDGRLTGWVGMGTDVHDVQAWLRGRPG